MAQSITQSLQRRLHNIHRSQDVDGLRRLRITNRPDKLLHISTWIPSLSYATHSTINYSTEYVAEFLRLLNTFNIHTRIKCSFTGLETLAFTIGSHGYMDELYEYILRNKRDKNIEDVITEAEILYDKLMAQSSIWVFKFVHVYYIKIIFMKRKKFAQNFSL